VKISLGLKDNLNSDELEIVFGDKSDLPRLVIYTTEGMIAYGKTLACAALIKGGFLMQEMVFVLGCPASGREGVERAAVVSCGSHSK